MAPVKKKVKGIKFTGAVYRHQEYMIHLIYSPQIHR
jgi:hypothetical protein